LNEKVSTFWQCGMALFPPLGIWAFYRIKKLRLGLLLYSIVVPLKFLYLIIPFPFDIVIWIGSLVLLLWYMQKWSEKWNETASDIDTEARDRNLKSSYPERYSKDEEAEDKKN